MFEKLLNQTLIYGMIIFAMAALVMPLDVFSALRSYGGGARYFYIGQMVIFFSLWLLFFNSRGLLNIFLGVLLLIIFVNSASYFSTPPRTDYNWNEQVKDVGEDPTSVKIPPNWEIMVCRYPCNFSQEHG